MVLPIEVMINSKLTIYFMFFITTYIYIGGTISNRKLHAIFFRQFDFLVEVVARTAHVTNVKALLSLWAVLMESMRKTFL